MSRFLNIECERVLVEHCDSNSVRVNFENPYLGFIKELTEDEIVSYCDNDVDLFRRLLKNDDVQNDLHEYLRECGYEDYKEVKDSK